MTERKKEQVNSTVRALIVRKNMSDQMEIYLQQKSKGIWEIPGGKINFGQTAAEAIQCEVQEEANIKNIPVSRFHKKGSSEYINPQNSKKTTIHFFLIRIEPEKSKKMTHEKADFEEDKLVNSTWVLLSDFQQSIELQGFLLINGEKAELSGNTTNLSPELKTWIDRQLGVSPEPQRELRTKCQSLSFN